MILLKSFRLSSIRNFRSHASELKIFRNSEKQQPKKNNKKGLLDGSFDRSSDLSVEELLFKAGLYC